MPKGWTVCNISDIGRFISGKTLSINEIGEGTIPYFKVSSMNIEGNEVYLQYTSVYTRNCVFPQNSIVFPKNGGALLTNKKRILKHDSCCDLNMGGITLYDNDILDYFYLWFQSVNLSSISIGGVIPTINSRIISTIQVLLPPKNECWRIAGRLKLLYNMLDAITAEL